MNNVFWHSPRRFEEALEKELKVEAIYSHLGGYLSARSLAPFSDLYRRTINTNHSSIRAWGIDSFLSKSGTLSLLTTMAML